MSVPSPLITRSPARLSGATVFAGTRVVEDFGWGDEDDGPLLRLLKPVCDVFVTVDRNLPFQQRLEHRPFATVVLLARSNRVADLLPLVPKLIKLVPQVAPGSISRIASQPVAAADLRPLSFGAGLHISLHCCCP